jgi:hypothetical protein
MDSREQLRRSYLPDRVRVLFIGESPPASGRFFYQKDAGLYRVFRDAFRSVNPTIGDSNFLQKFRQSGCYLIDLCADPVDNLPPRDRREACRIAEPELAQALLTHQPPTIVTFLKSIEENVTRAIQQANWTGQLFATPYPGRFKKNRERFFEVLAPVLQDLYP